MVSHVVSFQGEPVVTEAYAAEILRLHVPRFYELFSEMTNPTSQRLSAAEALSQFMALRESLPSEIRFAPPTGYRKDLLIKVAITSIAR